LADARLSRSVGAAFLAKTDLCQFPSTMKKGDGYKTLWKTDHFAVRGRRVDDIVSRAEKSVARSFEECWDSGGDCAVITRHFKIVTELS
jgi:hypothetical protein